VHTKGGTASHARKRRCLRAEKSKALLNAQENRM